MRSEYCKSTMLTKDEYIAKNQSYICDTSRYSEPKYQCECGGNMRKRLDIVLASYPPKYNYECDKCGKIDILEV